MSTGHARAPPSRPCQSQQLPYPRQHPNIPRQVDSRDVIRPDSSRVILIRNPTWKSELLGLYTTIRIEPFVLLLFPMFFSSNWFYTYQFNSVNGARFNVRTRALNSTLYYLSQIVGAGVFGYCLDFKGVRRTIRARWAWGVLFALTMVGLFLSDSKSIPAMIDARRIRQSGAVVMRGRNRTHVARSRTGARLLWTGHRTAT